MAEKNRDNIDIFNEYDITSSARDFSLSNIVELIETGQIEIPLFQREYVWDVKRASKLIDSFILNLPVPEIFLFMDVEDGRYKVIDGQQRLMSIYFYFKQRFPRDIKKDKTARTRMHELINNNTTLLPSVIEDEKYFKLFRLEFEEDYTCKNDKKTFNELDEETKAKLRLRRSIRAQVLRQNKPDDGGSAMFEVFNRLNTGGARLTQQEIRASLFYCSFYNMMQKMNNQSLWRRLQDSTKDIHAKDIEHILTGFAFLEKEDSYFGNKQKFLNKYSRESMKFDSKKIAKMGNVFIRFIEAFENVDEKIFLLNKNFCVLIYETIFPILCADLYSKGGDIIVDVSKIKQLLTNSNFKACLEKSTSMTATVERKFSIARKILLS